MIQSILQIVMAILFLVWDIKMLFGYKKNRLQDVVFYGVNAVICLIVFESYRI